MKGNGFKIAFVALCLVAAGVLVYRNMSVESEVPAEYRNLAASLPWYKCTKCNHEIQLKAEQLGVVETKSVIISSSTPGLRSSNKPLIYIECPTCKEFTALLGNRCEIHQVTFYPVNLDGTRGRCEKCTEETSDSNG